MILTPGRELTLQECRILLRLDGTLEQAQEGWVFDYRKIDKALDFLKISHRVRLGFKAGIWKYGDHDSFSGTHKIKVSTYLEIEDANESLWHELVHASQAERLWRQSGVPIYNFYKAYENAMGESGRKYLDNTFEIEARFYASRYKKMALLS
jgi:ornithine carbamoyltransferase